MFYYMLNIIYIYAWKKRFFTERSKILLNIDQQIILLESQK